MKVGKAAHAPQTRYKFNGFILSLGFLLVSPATILAQGARSAVPMNVGETSARDLSGVWVEQGRQNVSLMTSAQQQSPLTAWGKAQFKAAKSADLQKPTRRAAVNDPHKFCDPVGMPRADLTTRPIEIVETPDEVFFFYEQDHSGRQIYMDGRALPESPDPSYLGYSVGKWEGDTLVVDTVGLNDKTWLDDAGHPHSEALHVIERIRRTGADRLEVSLTIEDAKAYSKTWTSAPRIFERKRGYELTEDYCVAADSLGARKAASPAAAPEK